MLERLVPFRLRYAGLHETPLPLRLLVRTDTYRDIALWVNEHLCAPHFHTRPLRIAIAYPSEEFGVGSRVANRSYILQPHLVDIYAGSKPFFSSEHEPSRLWCGIPLFLTTDVPPGRVFVVKPPSRD